MHIVSALLGKIALAVTIILGLLLQYGHSFSYPNNIQSATPSSPTVVTASKIEPTATSTKIIRLPSPTRKPSPTTKTSPKISSPAPTATAPSSSPDIAADTLNTQTRAAVVNVLCTTLRGGSFEPISGSGIIIDPRGIILTNAHVAQFFLLRNYPFANNVQCVIRTGNPARATYTAELLYLPPPWIDENAKQIVSDHPAGTGENDYAFLRITGTTDGSPLLNLPYLQITTKNPQVGVQMLLSSYPAGFLDGITIQNSLYQTSAYAIVTQLYVFDASHQWIDIFSIPGSVVSQSGSSGGAAVWTEDGSLGGIIVTDTESTTTSMRDLRALTINHVDHSLQAQGLGGIVPLLRDNAANFAASFNKNTAPQELAKLIDALKSSK